jgi:microcystin-dependent protein
MDPFIGQIMQVGFAYAPVNWLTCNGQTLQVNQNQALFALLGNRFGGNGTSNFGLPDAQGRALVGTGMGFGLTPRRLGEKGGGETQTLTLPNMPSHTHGVTNSGGSLSVGGHLLAMQGVDMSVETAQPAEGMFLGAALEQDTSPVLYAPANSTGTPVSLGGLSVQAQYQPPTFTVNANGGNAPFSIMPPFQAVTTIIAGVGIWPEQP